MRNIVIYIIIWLCYIVRIYSNLFWLNIILSLVFGGLIGWLIGQEIVRKLKNDK